MGRARGEDVRGSWRVLDGIGSCGHSSVFLLTSHLSRLTAQDAPAKKLQASLARVFGDGALADTVQGG